MMNANFLFIALLIVRQILADYQTPYWLFSLLCDLTTIVSYIELVELKITSGVMDLLRSRMPPTLATLKALRMESFDLATHWGVYLLILEKESHKPRIYVGSGSSYDGIISRMGSYWTEKQTTTFSTSVRASWADGFHTTHITPLCLIKPPLKPVVHMQLALIMCLVLESVFTFALWAMRSKTYGSCSELCLWKISDLHYTGLCTHTPMSEITNWLRIRFPHNLAIDAETLQQYGRQRQRESAARSDAKIRERLTCVDCGNSYARQIHYDAHLLKCGVPGPEKDFVCDCGKAYLTKCTLQEHQRQKHGNVSGMGELSREKVENYYCDRCPQSTFTHHEGLRRHQRDLHGEYSGEGFQDPFTTKKPRMGNKLVCAIPSLYEPECTASYDTRSELRKHQRSVHQKYAGAGLIGDTIQDTYVVNELQCACAKKFRTRTDLRRHQKREHGSYSGAGVIPEKVAKAFKCTAPCTSSFAILYQLKEHQIKVHKVYSGDGLLPKGTKR